MFRNLIKKILLYLLTFFFICSLNFCLIHLMPGDAMIHLLGEEGYSQLSFRGEERLEALKADFGMDGTIGEKYTRYLVKIVTGDWGWTFYYGQPVVKIVFERLQWTLLLLFPAVFTATILGGWMGALSGWYSHRRSERLVPAFFLIIYAIPGYCISLLLLAAVAQLQFLPMGGMMPTGAGPVSILCHMALPFAVLTLNGTAYKYMIMRNAVRQELNAPYVLTAMSKGLTDRQILFLHILKNVLPPYISVVALHFGFMVGGALLVEIVFSWQGMGTLLYQAVLSRDFPLLSGVLMILSISVLSANLAADLLYALCDPRIKESNHGK
jgi:peptide/nickel transport system permease protein